MEEKIVLRRQLLARRKAMTPAQLEASTARICAHLRLFAAPYEIVAAYEPFGTEPGGQLLLPLLRETAKVVMLPTVDHDNDLTWSTGEASFGLEGIMRAQLIVVPALAADRAGYRLGRGGGSYDRALARSSTAAIRVTLLHEGELLEHVPAEPHDQRVEFAITPAGVTELDR